MYPDNREAEYELLDGTTFGPWGGAADVLPFQPYNSIFFAVDDLESAVSVIKARGISVTRHETRICFLALINDTEGDTVGFA